MFHNLTVPFERLPTEVAGQARSPHFNLTGPDRYTVLYGESWPENCSPLRLQALDVSTGDFFPRNWTAGDVITMQTRGAGSQVVAAGRDSALVWIQSNTTCSIGSSRVVSPVFTLSWGNAAGPWVFSVQANTPEELDALVAAVVAAA